LTNHEELDHQAGIFSGLWLACKKLWLFFGLAEKRQKHTFPAGKICILKNLRLNVWQKALIISLDGKKCTVLFTATVN